MSLYNFDGHKLFYQFETAYKLLSDQPVNPLYVEYSPVGNCNHRCLFCAYDYMGYKHRRLETEAAVRSIKQFADLGTRAMLFAGEGEPLIHPDFSKMIETCYENNVDSGVYSNGAMLTEKKAAELLDKLTFMRVSFNAGTKENYHRIHGRDDFDLVVKNLKYAVELKHKKGLKADIGLQFVVIPENLHTVVDMAKLGREIGADYLAIKPFVQHSSQEYNFEQNFKLEEIEDILEEAVSFTEKDYHVIARKESFRKYHNRTYDHCLALPLFSVVLSDGSVYSCGPHLENEEFLYGNILESDVIDIMNGEKRQKVLAFAKNQLDCKKHCMPNCRLDAINRSLWEIKYPTVKHVNFI